METIRFYEKLDLLAAPGRTVGNYRAYEPAHLARLSFIRRARDLGFTLDQVRELLDLADDRGRSCAGIDAIATSHLAAVDRKIIDLQALRGELDRMIGSCRQGTVASCRIVETLAPGRGAA